VKFAFYFKKISEICLAVHCFTFRLAHANLLNKINCQFTDVFHLLLLSFFRLILSYNMYTIMTLPQLNLIMSCAAIEAIFASERVQDIVSVSKDSVLILGQGERSS